MLTCVLRVCCSVLQWELQCVAALFKFNFFGSVLQCVAVCCSGYCSVLQRVAACCSVLQRVAACGSVLQRVAVRCSVLQCVTPCSTICVTHCSGTGLKGDVLVLVVANPLNANPLNANSLNACSFETNFLKAHYFQENSLNANFSHAYSFETNFSKKISSEQKSLKANSSK